MRSRLDFLRRYEPGQVRVCGRFRTLSAGRRSPVVLGARLHLPEARPQGARRAVGPDPRDHPRPTTKEADAESQHQLLARVVPVLRRRGEVDDADALRRGVLAEQRTPSPTRRPACAAAVTTRTDLGFPVHELRVRGDPGCSARQGLRRRRPGLALRGPAGPARLDARVVLQVTRWRPSGPGATRTGGAVALRAAVRVAARRRHRQRLRGRLRSRPRMLFASRDGQASSSSALAPACNATPGTETAPARGCGSPGSGSRGRGGQAATAGPGRGQPAVRRPDRPAAHADVLAPSTRST